jgi:hypothetical protein
VSHTSGQKNLSLMAFPFKFLLSVGCFVSLYFVFVCLLVGINMFLSFGLLFHWVVYCLIGRFVNWLVGW